VDDTKFRAAFGLEPTGWKEGLEATLGWFSKK
jgi:hypothetical protein